MDVMEYLCQDYGGSASLGLTLILQKGILCAILCKLSIYTSIKGCVAYPLMMATCFIHWNAAVMAGIKEHGVDSFRQNIQLTAKISGTDQFLQPGINIKECA